MKKYQNGFAPILILVIMALAALGYFAFQNYQLKKIIGKPSTSPFPTSSPIVNPTADWKTYKSEKFNFQISYPSSLTTRESLTGVQFVDGDIPRMEVDTINNLNPKTSKSYSKIEEMLSGNGIRFEQVTFGENTWNHDIDSNLKSYYLLSPKIIYFFILNDNNYSVDQILSTFKFTN